MTEKPIRFDVPATMESPACRIEGPVVEQLPESANIGDFVTFNGSLWLWNGVNWLLQGTREELE